MFKRRTLLYGVAALALFALAVTAGKGGSKPPKDPPSGGDPAIAFRVNRSIDAVNGGDLWVMDADGENPRFIHAAGDGPAAWSPDGKTLAFGDSDGIYVINVDGTGFQRVVATSFNVGKLDWSPVPAPDGEYRFAFQTWVDEDGGGTADNRDIFVASIDGSAVINLTNTSDANEQHPVWSRDASKIAFTRQPVFNWAAPCELVVLELGSVDGSLGVVAETNPTQSGPLENYHVTHPSWARTQDRLVVCASLDGPSTGVPKVHDLWVIDWLDRDNPVEITAGFDVQNLRQPCWSPDDSYVIYNGGNEEYPTGSIWLIASDGSEKVELVPREKGTKETNPFHPHAVNRVFPIWRR